MTEAFANANVRSFPAHQDTIKDTIRAASDNAKIITWQEMDADLYGSALLDALPGYAHFWGIPPEKTARDTLAKVIKTTPHYASPISWDPNEYRKIDGGSFVFQKGADYISYGRFWTWVLLEEISSGYPLLVSAGHFWPGAWDNQGDDDALRQAEWNRGRDLVLKNMGEIQAKHGYPPMYIGIDANRTGVSMFPESTFNGYPVHNVENGLDWMIFIDGKGHPWEIPPRGFSKVPIQSDHDGMFMKGAWLHPAFEPPLVHEARRHLVIQSSLTPASKEWGRRVRIANNILRGVRDDSAPGYTTEPMPPHVAGAIEKLKAYIPTTTAGQTWGRRARIANNILNAPTIKPQRPPAPAARADLVRPVPFVKGVMGWIGTAFGVRGDWKAGKHTGEDFVVPEWTPVVSTYAGTVVGVGNVAGAAYGPHQVMIESAYQGHTIRHLYAHMNEATVTVGQKVRAGDLIGRSGNLGNTTGPHLHREERRAPFGYYDYSKPVLIPHIAEDAKGPYDA